VREFLDVPGLTLEVVPAPWSVSPATLAAVRRLLAKYRPEVFHFLYSGIVGPYPWLAYVHGVKRVIFTDQGSHPEGYTPTQATSWKRAIARVVNAPLHRVTCISESNLRTAAEIGYLKPGQGVRIYNGVYLPSGLDLDGLSAAFRSRFAVPQDRMIVLQVSSLIPAKGIEDLLDAAALVLRERQDVQFVFGGDGEYASAYREKAASLGIAEHVTWTGLLQNPILDGAFPAADVVCQVSRWSEAFGITIAEAMSVCRPVIATAVGGIPELIDDGVTGYLVPKRDPGAIADRVLRLLADPAMRARMGSAARAKCEAEFDLQKIVAQYLREYGVT
jgi:glycosyltransferase involved in cell wall biosynthesis